MSVVSCTACAYAANLEKAEIPAPAATAAESPAPLAKVHTPNVRTVAEVADFFNIPLEKVLKTLLYETETGPVAVLLRGDHELNEVKLKNYLKVNDLTLASEDAVRRDNRRCRRLCRAYEPLTFPFLPISVSKPAANLVAGANEDHFHYTNVNLRSRCEILKNLSTCAR